MKTCVLGLGYVGLPLALAAAKAGHQVVGYDPNREKIAALLASKSYIDDVPAGEITEQMMNGQFLPTSLETDLDDITTYVICVPTPLTEDSLPDVSAICDSGALISRVLKSGDLVILESTTYPGTTEQLLKPILEASGLKAGLDFNLVFSPERVDPKNKKFSLADTPKLVAGLTPSCLSRGVAFYGTFISKTVPVSTLAVAEMAKLVENSYRFINIAFVNELASICDVMGIDVWEVIRSADTKPYGYSAFWPGPGVGGHCIPVDPIYLSTHASTFYKRRFRTIELAQEINSEMPSLIVQKLKRTWISSYGDNSTIRNVLLLGVSYKANISDTRESPALRIAELLQHEGITVSWFDSNVIDIPEELKHSTRVTSLGEVDNETAVILLQPHDDIKLNLTKYFSNFVLDCCGESASIINLPTKWHRL